MQVSGHLGVGDRDPGQSRILDLILDRRGDDCRDPLGQTLCPCGISHDDPLPLDPRLLDQFVGLDDVALFDIGVRHRQTTLEALANLGRIVLLTLE